ncbi:hypothetical protein ACIP88_36345 [Streptomyces uncialis]
MSDLGEATVTHDTAHGTFVVRGDGDLGHKSAPRRRKSPATARRDGGTDR